MCLRQKMNNIAKYFLAEDSLNILRHQGIGKIQSCSDTRNPTFRALLKFHKQLIIFKGEML